MRTGSQAASQLCRHRRRDLTLPARRPETFADADYMRDERTYKVEAQERLEAILPLDAASEATALQALQVRRAFSKTNVLDSTEFARAHEMLGGPNGQAFVRAAARFARDELEAGLAGMSAA